jgi:pimeloyl-ACP methyl ester carboxylesterase
MAIETGASLFVEDSGAGEPALLLHSSGLSGRQWRRLASELVTSGKRAIVPDLTGHGRSEPWLEPLPFSFRTDVLRVTEILRAAAPAHVVGHSYGALLALHVALASPGSVRSLSLFDPVTFGVLDRAKDQDARAILASLDLTWGPAAADRERFLAGFVDFWGGAGAWLSLREEARAEFRRVGWVVREGVRSLTEDTTPAEAYAIFRFPVSLVTGELSPLPAQRVIERLAEAIPGAHVTAIPGAGHMGPMTHADAVNRTLLEGLAPTSPMGTRSGQG